MRLKHSLLIIRVVSPMVLLLEGAHLDDAGIEWLALVKHSVSWSWLSEGISVLLLIRVLAVLDTSADSSTVGRRYKLCMGNSFIVSRVK